MEDFIRKYEKVVPNEWCDALIQKYEDFDDQHEVFDDQRVYTQINFAEDVLWQYESDYLSKVFLEQVERYKEDVKIENQWPSKYTLEPLRMKRYLPNEKDNFPPHVDVTGTDNNSRFLVMFLYLSNNEKWETVYPKQKSVRNNTSGVSPCTKGNVLLFPPMWPWLHYGNFAVETPKYMVGSYLHYVD